MLFADETDRYFESEETAADFYYPLPAEEVPEWMYDTQDYQVPAKELEKAHKAVLDAFDSIPELQCFEDSSFSETVSEEDSDLLFDLLSTWINHVARDIVIPNYEEWIEFRPIYKDYCEEVAAGKKELARRAELSE